MKDSPFYFEIKDIMTQFVGAFNDIIIDRHDKSKSVRSRAHVRYVYAPKQRVVHDLTNKARHLTLPVVAVSISSIQRDQKRVFNKIEGAYFASEEKHAESTKSHLSTVTHHMKQPVPININVDMSILARYQTDIEQIISNFAPYNDPYIILSWKLPAEFTGTDQEIRSEVLWDGNLALNYPEELSASEPFRVACDTSFTVKTWLFKKASKPITNIHKITTNMTPVSDITPDFSFSLPFYDDVTERSYMQGLGPALSAAPFITHINTDTGESNEILGYNFNTTTAIYLSSANINSLSGVEVEPYADSNPLSTIYPPFSGVKVEHTKRNDYKIHFDIPPGVKNDTLDLIVLGIGGYDTALGSTLHGKGIFLT
jgi:hypothetical protein